MPWRDLRLRPKTLESQPFFFHLRGREKKRFWVIFFSRRGAEKCGHFPAPPAMETNTYLAKNVAIFWPRISGPENPFFRFPCTFFFCFPGEEKGKFHSDAQSSKQEDSSLLAAASISGISHWFSLGPCMFRTDVGQGFVFRFCDRTEGRFTCRTCRSRRENTLHRLTANAFFIVRLS